MEYIITPFEGLGDVKFGMMRKDVKKFLGKPPTTKIDEIMEETVEENLGMKLRYTPKLLSEIEISKYVEKAMIFGTPVFTDPNIDEVLRKHSKDIVEYREYVNYRDIGLLTCGFNGAKTKNGKFITIYSKERVRFYNSFMKSFV